MTRVRNRSRRRQNKRTKRMYNRRRVGGHSSYVPVPYEKVFIIHQETSEEPKYYTNMNGDYEELGVYDPELNWETLQHIYDPHKMKFKNGKKVKFVDNSLNNKVFKKV